MPGTLSVTKQFLCPSEPKFKEDDVPDLTNKVVIVTGSNTGLGKEIARILYAKHAKVYMMARSEQKTREAMQDIRQSCDKSNGELHFIHLDLSDLTGIKSSVEEFTSREDKLHLLFNNAGVGYPEPGSKTKQGYELQLGVNCLGPFLLTKLLAPTMISTAKASPRNTVRIVWVSSSAAEAVKLDGYVENLSQIDEMGAFDKYGISKMGNYLHAAEFARRYKESGIISVSLNPGALDSDFWRNQGSLMTSLLQKTVLHPPVYGAYTNLFAAFSPEVDLAKSGSYIAPWGQLWKVSKEMVDAARIEADGGTGIAEKFYEWTDDQIKQFI